MEFARGTPVDELIDRLHCEPCVGIAFIVLSEGPVRHDGGRELNEQSEFISQIGNYIGLDGAEVRTRDNDLFELIAGCGRELMTLTAQQNSW